jgi:tRNA(Arg) A34 adenosine deaminase TadA
VQTNDEQWMLLAIEAAKTSRIKYGHAIGALIVRDDKVVMTAYSVDNNHHAELNCIQNLLRKTGRRTLDGCIMYTTQEPCSMCFGAVLYANIERLIFGAFASDMPPNNTYESKDFSVENLAKNYNRFDGGKVEIVSGVLRDECRTLTSDHEFWTVKGFDQP